MARETKKSPRELIVKRKVRYKTRLLISGKYFLKVNFVIAFNSNSASTYFDTLLRTFTFLWPGFASRFLLVIRGNSYKSIIMFISVFRREIEIIYTFYKMFPSVFLLYLLYQTFWNLFPLLSQVLFRPTKVVSILREPKAS